MHSNTIISKFRQELLNKVYSSKRYLIYTYLSHAYAPSKYTPSTISCKIM